MSIVFPSGHGNGEDWLSRMSRKCCEDNRMCPGSAVEGLRIQGSYCTLWNGLRNARCLPFFFFLFRSESYHMLEATGFEDNVTPIWCMCGTALAHGCLWWPTSTFSSDRLKVAQMNMTKKKPPSAVTQADERGHFWSCQQGGWQTRHLEKKRWQICSL